MILPALRLGPVAIDFPVVLAALSGYSDWPMRAICRRLGAPYAVSEALLDRFVLDVSRGRKARRSMRVADEDHPAGAQLMGSGAAELVPAALRLAEAGFDVIDVNFACPVKKVLGRCRGGYLLGQPAKALEIVARLRDALPDRVPLTVKLRRGTDDGPAGREAMLRVFDGAFALGTAAVTVHGRTVRQGYEGRASWDCLRELKERAGGRAVLGSGDLFTARACLDMMARTGVDGVTVARGAIGNPWIFREVRALAAGGPPPAPPSLAEQREVIAEHYRLAEETYGPKRCARIMRKFGIRYARLHPRADEVRAAFIAVRAPGEWREALDRWYR